MGHDHSHNHTNGANKKTLVISFIIITGYMIIEAFGGFITNSLALLSDAGHMLSDSISLGIALIAFTLGAKRANTSKTFGYKRFEILAAVLNGITLILISLYIFYEALQRFKNPPEVASTGMLIIALAGLLVNIVVAWIMLRGSDVEENLNMRGAYLHVISDMLGSIGAVIAALLIMFFGWGWADPLASVIVAALVLRSGFYVTKSGLHVLMEGSPSNVDTDTIIKTIKTFKEVKTVHDFHVWSVTSGLNALSCHIVVDDKMSVAENESLLKKIEHELNHKNIQHVTIQTETSNNHHSERLFCDIKEEKDDHH
ncbi:cation diffusion facilitator family transporter [Staphylococcus haemolyticus]|uniref:cation diffusion facilitator family transporter n=1 Tax=Staphylococcus haemolyticus TaxID=1283 RepID=UPI0028A36959|nr:cation diffusion facilitator family transporter [Staphylococcus haemolyticus]MDT4192284.1 cation diffusion facilitator family transporter [Staphylococcus haemolyticus]MDT4197485.1 cation diffusion facilitator family transporter [Staphylococcus haemolyticus]MDT4199966.1 cation diffusion facilitator family transporter [Staphylococcus haemolyticus]MDT4207802.1 cation diffusion facilitator family transporter [Staphylococcus haemolyticus]MDT4210192.1 cation diffusion facilitator family transport